ncbi:hypothetical protein C3K47_18975 [Solitalea longa]|uniref:Uncharacterized protein n=1 Tax=Solitalea longa TaxID=2079460 RepID=A0A2S4ZWH3_9SPHI|nr:hypothetical protein [Solitalea longa]POY34718.1 hypothetical protein C3K47_18975 [Solitalea longa]
MARQKGSLKYVGTLGDIRHFKIKGQKGYFAGMVGGPTSQQVKTASEFSRTRENMNEFGGSAKAGKSLRTAFSALLNSMSDSQLTGRVTAVMKKINLEDQSEARGYRAILISQQPQYLLGIQFNRKINFDTVFNVPFAVTPAVNRLSADLQVEAFDPFSKVRAPLGATHFKVVLALGVVSDYAYNEATKTYEPLAAAENEASAVAISGFQDLKQTVPALNLSAALSNLATVSTDATVMAAIGVEFYQQVGANYYLLNGSNALKLIATF